MAPRRSALCQCVHAQPMPGSAAVPRATCESEANVAATLFRPAVVAAKLQQTMARAQDNTAITAAPTRPLGSRMLDFERTIFS